MIEMLSDIMICTVEVMTPSLERLHNGQELLFVDVVVLFDTSA